jgi:hypothetical protein
MTATSIHVPLPVPDHSDAHSPPVLLEKEQTLYDRVLDHFSGADYIIPGINEDKAALMVDEKFWLVSAISYHSSIHAFG